MTYSAVYKSGVQILKTANCENASFDAFCLFEKSFNMNKTDFLLMNELQAENNKSELFYHLVERRTKGEPLQYILEEWDFMGFTFCVGEGVLIPRPETELLVDVAVNTLKDKEKAIVFDLCAGSGCVGLSVAKYCPNSTVYLIEKSPQAFVFLKKNAEKLNLPNAHLVLGDVTNNFTDFSLPIPDIILSNPPYIPSGELKTLQLEVQQEPAMALDGGKDGLFFYQVITEKWLSVLQDKGMAAVECGEGQASAIAQLFSSISKNIEIIQDLRGIERVVALKI